MWIGGRTSHAERNLQVYTRRRNPSIQPSSISDIAGGQAEQPQLVEQEQLPINDNEVENSLAPAGEDINSSIDLPIALRKGMRSTAGKPPERYGFEDSTEDENDIANYVSYGSLSSTYKAFVASLQSVAIPRDWKEAKRDPKWKKAMLEELAALEKNNTWDLVPFPLGKKVVSCKWVYTVKQNPDGKIEKVQSKIGSKRV
jgi:hypothetical protein